MPSTCKQIMLSTRKQGRGYAFYLPSAICDEMIELMGQRVLSVIVDEIKTAKYFSISFDSTPNIMHVDQLTVSIRYVLQSGPVIRFLKCIPIFSHTGSKLLKSFFSSCMKMALTMKAVVASHMTMILI